jgi:hypothetical protein
MIRSFITLVPSQLVFRIDRRAQPGAQTEAQPTKVSDVPSCRGCVGQRALHPPVTTRARACVLA